MNEKFLKPYDPKNTEGKIYEVWQKSGFFNPDNLPERHKDPFTIIMPPPNANGSLHAGHAVFVTLEDLMVRYKRMQGFKSLWVPGADHAGFETQVVYEKKLEKEGRSRFKMEPKELYDEIMSFTLHNKSFMEGQLRELGASCDWSREKFTLEPEIIKTVNDTFKKLSDDDLLYRGKRIVNWCTKHQTSLSELETTAVEQIDKFYYFKYGPFTIGTTRPETKFGDKYVVMNPKDERYSEYKHGQKIDLEWINGPITATIIKDEAVDMEFGTGVMTITPWHDAVDFEIGKRHDLDCEQIIDFNGKLLPIAGPEFEGKNINNVREDMVKKLESKGLLVRIDENYNHTVKTCYKCNRIIEPQIKEQWFVKMKPLAEKAVEAVESGEVNFVTEKYKKIFLHWMNIIEDWNISRQIVWGIPIPAKICEDCGEGMVDLENEIVRCTKCGGAVRQDPDTFDTWFSSGQWPFAALSYPEGEDFKEFYPTDVMETGADIIFFWVAKMIMFGIYRTGKVPFKNVYLHGMVRDGKGLKMSKSKGNVVNPLDMSDKYGTDALRMALVIGNTPGTDMNLDEAKIKGQKHFANKLWNITRFVLSNTEEINFENRPEIVKADIKLLEELDETVKEVTKNIEAYRFYLAGEIIYHYVWDRFASEILEESKSIIEGSDDTLKNSRKWTLIKILRDTLKVLHPFMPFITEEI
ncbi:valine--tRNA ligase, partial [Patescibacteria group bacterium]|nr:valine--tRNA ligase [Patescibacteria group bacterium]